MSDQKTVAILGASSDRTKFGNKSVRAHAQQGWKVYPVNPKGGEIEGHKVYTSLADVPRPLDRVSMYLPPALGAASLAEVKAADAGEFFVNPGAESDELVEKAKELGLDPILACSIVDVGMTPGEVGD